METASDLHNSTVHAEILARDTSGLICPITLLRSHLLAFAPALLLQRESRFEQSAV